MAVHLPTETGEPEPDVATRWVYVVIHGRDTKQTSSYACLPFARHRSQLDLTTLSQLGGCGSEASHHRECQNKFSSAFSSCRPTTHKQRNRNSLVILALEFRVACYYGMEGDVGMTGWLVPWCSKGGRRLTSEGPFTDGLRSWPFLVFCLAVLCCIVV